MENTELSLQDFLVILQRRKWHFLLPAGFVFLLSAAIALLLPPIYKSTATILIEEQEIPANLVISAVTTYAQQRLQVINQRIMSTSRLLEIINRFNLYNEYKGKWTTEEMIAKMRKDITLDYINADIAAPGGSPRAAAPTLIAFSLSYEGKGDPSKVQSVANILSSFFLEENLKVRKQQVTETSDFFEKELASIKVELDFVNAQIADFKKEHVDELPELLQVNMQSLHDVENSSERYHEQLRNLRERAEQLQGELSGVSPSFESIKSGDADQNRLDQMTLELVKLRSTYSDKYPDVIKAKDEIARLEQQIANKPSDAVDKTKLADNPAYINLSSQLASVRSEIQSVSNQMQGLEDKAAEYRKKISATPEVERVYKEMLNRRDNMQVKYDDLSRKNMEMKVAEGLETDQKGERFTLIDPAKMPEKPLKPNRLAIMLIGVVLGVGAGVGWAALIEFNDDAVRKAEALSRATSFPVLAHIPRLTIGADIRQARQRKFFGFLTAFCLLLVAIAAFHFLVMDLDVFAAKIMRRMNF